MRPETCLTDPDEDGAHPGQRYTPSRAKMAHIPTEDGVHLFPACQARSVSPSCEVQACLFAVSDIFPPQFNMPLIFIL